MAFTPENREYIIKGRIYDKTTSQFLEGVNVQSIGGETTKTDNQGRFEITISLETNPEDNTVSPTGLMYTKDGYIPVEQSITTGNNLVKTDLSNVGLLNIETAAKQEINEITTEVNDKIDDVRGLLNIDFASASSQAVMRIVLIITTKLIPLLLGLLVTFGITKLSQRANKVCPNGDVLRNNIRRRNRVTKQLNNIFAKIAANTALAALFQALATQFQAAATSTLAIPIPTPPIVSEIVRRVQNLAEDLRLGNRKLLIALVYLIAGITAVVNLLRGLDELTAECAEEADIDLDQVAIDEELLALVDQEQNTGYNNTEVNGFTLSVQVDDEAVGSLKRRFAVARDAGGVAVLEGEKSLGSNDQILIDELAYYIRINELKAV